MQAITHRGYPIHGGMGPGWNRWGMHSNTQRSHRGRFNQGLHHGGGVGVGAGGRAGRPGAGGNAGRPGAGGRDGGVGAGGRGSTGGRGIGRGIIGGTNGPPRSPANTRQIAHPIKHAPHKTFIHPDNPPIHFFTQATGSTAPLHFLTHGITPPTTQIAPHPQAMTPAATTATCNACG